MSGKNEVANKKKVPQVTGYDRGPKDFFRASTGQPWKKGIGFGGKPKDFLGFRRGSR